MLAEGQSVGNYRILSKIGTGGMGAVYLAEHPLIGKKVALKVIHRELSGNKEVVRRFFQEAKAVNTIGHEHIIEIHDFGMSDDGDHFYIMEYLEGRTLASVIGREHRLEVTRALHIAAQIASALAAAHASSVIHRDLKPDNIMLVTKLGDPDFVKVLDFGLAKFMTGDGAKQLTAAGVVLGTPQYMSPEACESRRDIDHRTDIYAVGVLLFQMACGQLPFDGQTMGEVLIKQVTQPPPAPRGLNPSIPPSVEQLILRCLAKPPDRRFQTMAALRDALLDPDAYLASSPPIMPARSVAAAAGSIDARTMIAAVHERARMTMPGQMPEGPMRPPSQPATVVGKISSQRPAVAAPGAANLPTMAMGGVPALTAPVPAKNTTMVIATPTGYSSRQPRGVWPIVMVVGLLGVIIAVGVVIGVQRMAEEGGGRKPGDQRRSRPEGGGRTAEIGDAAAVAVAGSGGGSGTGSGSGSGSGSGTGTGTGSGSGRGSGSGSTSGSAVAAKVRITFDTIPDGAEVRRAGQLLGKTPFTVEATKGSGSVTFVLQLKGYKTVTKRVDTSDHISILETLVRVQSKNGSHKKGSGSGSGSGTGNSDLLRPDDI